MLWVRAATSVAVPVILVAGDMYMRPPQKIHTSRMLPVQAAAQFTAFPMILTHFPAIPVPCADTSKAAPAAVEAGGKHTATTDAIITIIRIITIATTTSPKPAATVVKRQIITGKRTVYEAPTILIAAASTPMNPTAWTVTKPLIPTENRTAGPIVTRIIPLRSTVSI